jgi:hypothetical protein
LEAILCGSYNALVDLFDGEVAIDYDDTHIVAGGDFAVLVVDPGEEVGLFLLKAVFVVAGFLGMAGVAAAGATQGGVEVGEQEEGEIGLEVAAEEAVEVEDDGGAELASASLVGLCGVGEAVAEDDLAGCESGRDDLLDGLCAVGEHHGQLGVGGETGGFGVEQESAKLVAEGCSAGLTGDEVRQVTAVEPGGQALDLGGFAGAVESFESEEEAPVWVGRFRMHGWSLPFGRGGGQEFPSTVSG